MKLKFLVIAIVSLLLLAFLHLFADTTEIKKHPEVDFSISCKECHKQVTPDVYQDWKASKHGIMNFSCYMCHGDGQEEFYTKPGTERCVSCHSPQDVDFSKVAVNNCFDCHKGHTLKFHEK